MTPPAPRERAAEADLLRALACVTIVMIHVLAAAARMGSTDPTVLLGLEPFYQLALWATPTFAVLSGFVLQLTHPSPPNPREFRQRRLFAAWLPFATWALVYAAVFSPPVGTVQYFLGLVLGQVGQGHLYFAAMVLQFYAVFPWVWKAVTGPRALHWLVASLLLTLGYQGYFAYTPRPLGWSAFLWDASDSLLPGWLFYFLLGTLGARHRNAIVEQLSHYRGLWGPLAAAAALGLLWEYYQSPLGLNEAGSRRPAVVLYTVAVLPLLWLLACRLAATRLYAPGRVLASRSYAIYLVHPLCLELALRYFLPQLSAASLELRLAVLLGCTVGGTALLVLIASRSLLGSRLMGLAGVSRARPETATSPAGAGLASATAG